MPRRFNGVRMASLGVGCSPNCFEARRVYTLVGPQSIDQVCRASRPSYPGVLATDQMKSMSGVFVEANSARSVYDVTGDFPYMST